MLVKLLTNLLDLMKTLTGSLLVGTAVSVQLTNVLVCVALFVAGPVAILELCSPLT